jgi:hypothetical protein
MSLVAAPLAVKVDAGIAEIIGRILPVGPVLV